MPRRAATGHTPDWNRLLETAAGQAGCFTAGQAAEAGFSLPLVQYHLRTGKLERVRRGIFRVRHFPTHEIEEYVVLWLWSQQQGVFSHTTALALHQLSDVIPSRVHLTLPCAWARRRVNVPEGVIVHYADVPESKRAWHGLVPVTTPTRTLRDCSRDGLPGDLYEQAVFEGLRRGLFTIPELNSELQGRDWTATLSTLY
jgi:predicted transcriptional regulator of viral defense system